MKRTVFIIVLVFLTIAVAAVVATGGAQRDVTQLDGTSWVLIGLHGDNSLADVDVTASFLDGEISGNAGCNDYFGPYTLDGDNITLGAIGATEMYCMEPEGVMEHEAAYLDALRAVAKVRLTDGQLEMLNEDGDVLLRFERKDDAQSDDDEPVSLEGTHWSLVCFIDGDTTTSLFKGTSITLRFSEGQVGGSAGCNSYSGEYTSEGQTITSWASSGRSGTYEA